MQFYPECYSCILRQTAQLSTLAKIPESEQIPIIKNVMRALIDMPDTTTPPHMAGILTGMMKERTGQSLFDPYKALKKESNEKAYELHDDLKKRIAHSNDPLKEAVTIAAAGNIIDFGVFNHDMDILAHIEKYLASHFVTEEMSAFVGMLESAKTLLYLADNAGEIVLDKLLIETIKERYPDINITLAVRSAPILNDVTIDDARQVGMMDVCEVIESGSTLPGTAIEMCNYDFMNRFQRADVIISKGQGNFETLSDVKNDRLFFLLIAKCEIIARHIGYPVGSLLFVPNSMNG